MLSRRTVPLLSLCLVTLAIWCAFTHRWSVTAWSTPLQYHGDPLEVYARVQAAADDLSQPLRGFSSQPRLAAPFAADWSRYPVSDRVVFTLLGLLARLTGVFAAVNLAMAAVHVLNAAAFYLCARFLRWSRAWAFAGALLFTFCSYNFRWGVTVSFSLTAFIPPLLLLCGWIGRSAPAVATRGWTWLALALGAWLGGANPYLGFFAVQLTAGAVLLQWARRREYARWRAGVILITTAAISFLLHNAAYFLAPTDATSRLTLVRNYAGSEIYALKPIDLLIPPAEHPVAALGEIGRAYFAQSSLRTEFFVNYLGIAGIIGLAILVVISCRALARPRDRRIPDAFIGVLWTVVFSAVGGINSLLALTGFDVFRASNRNSIFILVWALLFLGRWCQRRWQPRFAPMRYVLPAVVAMVGILDSLPRLHAARALEVNAARLRDERELMAQLENRLGAEARVFQIPATAFPEAGVVAKMDDYEHFSPYLLSKRLHFSYGALRGTPMSRYIRSLGRLPSPILKERLEEIGFHALWINRHGLPENGDPLIARLRALNLEEFPQTILPHITIFLLHPDARPLAADVADARFFEPWDIISALPNPQLVVFDGWFDLEHDGERSWRWAQEVGTGGVRLPRSSPVELTFKAYSLDRAQIVVTCDDREVYRQVISPHSRDVRTIRLNLAAGRHTLTWRFTGRPLRPAGPDGRLLGFAVEDLRVTEVPADGGSH